MVNNVQVLRAIAALMVIATHVSRVNPLLPDSFGKFGAHGVDIFFVISGFIMVFTTAMKPVSPARFFGNRVLRIVPLYWLLTILLFLLATAAPSLLQSTRSDPGELIKSLLFIPFVRSEGVVQPVLTVGWTLNYEMFFYAIFALGLLISSRTMRMIAIMAPFVILAVLGMVFRPAHPILSFYTSSLILEFCFGMVLGLLYPRISASPPHPMLVVGLLLIGFAGFALDGNMAVPLSHLTRGFSASLIVYAAIALEAGGIRHDGRLMLLLGAASYSIYLGHQYLVILVDRVADHVGWGHGWGLGPVLLLQFVAAIAGGVLLHVLIERSMIAGLRRWFGHDSGANREDAAGLWPWRWRRPIFGRDKGDPRG
jgi:exopolysaccharide production protein ExoZ